MQGLIAATSGKLCHDGATPTLPRPDPLPDRVTLIATTWRDLRLYVRWSGGRMERYGLLLARGGGVLGLRAPPRFRCTGMIRSKLRAKQGMYAVVGMDCVILRRGMIWQACWGDGAGR